MSESDNESDRIFVGPDYPIQSDRIPANENTNGPLVLESYRILQKDLIGFDNRKILYLSILIDY